MEFGALASVEGIDWTLPPVPEISRHFLALDKSPHPLKVFFGAPAWGHREWIGKIYPEGTKPAQFLKHYAEAFGCIELNSSHYRIPSPEQTRKWRDLVPGDFIFCPKLAQTISHSGAGLRDPALLREWFTFTSSLGENLGPSFIQFPPNFSYAEKASLFQFLKEWPSEFPLALEFRHPSWFDASAPGQVRSALVAYLQERGMGLVITDVAGRRDVLHASLSARFAFVRFIANNLHPSDYRRSELWAQQLADWQALGLERVYFMVHEPDDVSAPEMATRLAGDFTKALGSEVRFPRREIILPSDGQTRFDL